MNPNSPKPDETPVPVVNAHFANKAALARAANVKDDSLTLFVTTQVALAVESPLQLHIELADSPRTFTLLGKVAFEAPHPRRTRGLHVRFTGEDKRVAAGMLAFCLGKPISAGTSDSRRIGIACRCEVKADGHLVAARLIDLSRTGAFVSADIVQPLVSAKSVELRLHRGVFGLFGRWVKCEPVWRGRKGGRYGVGVRFVGDFSGVTSVLQRHAKEQALKDAAEREKRRNKKPG